MAALRESDGDSRFGEHRLSFLGFPAYGYLSTLLCFIADSVSGYNLATMGQRKQPRVDATIEVRLFGMDGMEKPFTATAVTKEVSKTDAQIAGVQHYFKPGQTIGFSIAGKKYRCTVMWVGRHDTPLVGHISVQVQGHITPDWGISFPAHPIDSFSPKRIHESKRDSDSVSYFEYRAERRDAKPQPIRAGARLKPALGGTPGWGMCTDVSLGGCFIESASNVLAGTRLEL